MKLISDLVRQHETGEIEAVDADPDLIHIYMLAGGVVLIVSAVIVWAMCRVCLTRNDS